MSVNYTNLNNLSLGANGQDNATFTSSAINVGAITCTSISNSGAMSSSGALTVGGALKITSGSASPSANITALASSKSMYRMASTISVNLKGITAGADGQQLDLYFKVAGTQTLTITPSSTAAAAAAQILLVSTAASLISTGSGFASFVYSSTDSKWILKYLTA